MLYPEHINHITTEIFEFFLIDSHQQVNCTLDTIIGV